MSARCFDVVGKLLVVLLVEAQSTSKSTAVCPVAAGTDTQGDCRCTLLDEIQCRGLSAVPEVDVNASYAGRRTFRSLYLAGQRIRRLPAAAFAALNVRRIVLDFNPIGDRIDRRSFSGTVDAVDLARLGLTSRRRRTAHHVTGGRAGLVRSKRLRCFNASAEKNHETGSRRTNVTVADQIRRYDYD